MVEFFDVTVWKNKSFFYNILARVFQLLGSRSWRGSDISIYSAVEAFQTVTQEVRHLFHNVDDGIKK